MNSNLYNQLMVFHAIADAGSIVGAAKKLETQSPAISKSLKLLEQHIGTPLFYRTTRHISLTEEGQRLREKTLPAMNALALSLDEMRGNQETISGTVRLTLARVAYYLIIKPILAEWTARYPDIILEISLNDGTIDVVEQGFDIGIRFQDRVDDGMVARRLLPPIKLGLYASRDYAAQYGLPQTPAEIMAHRVIAYRFVTANRLAPIQLDGMAFLPPTSMISNDVDVIIDAVRAGVGIGAIFEPMAAQYADQDNMLAVLPQYWTQYPSVSLYYSPQTRNRRCVQTLVDFLMEKFK